MHEHASVAEPVRGRLPGRAPDWTGWRENGYHSEMPNIQITSVMPPFEKEDLYPRATRLLRRADAMGLLDEPIRELSPEVVRKVARALSKRFGSLAG